MNWFVIIIFLVILFIFYNSIENMNNIDNIDYNQCLQYGNDYNLCYSNPECTIWFRADGSTYCTKKFINEDI